MYPSTRGWHRDCFFSTGGMPHSGYNELTHGTGDNGPIVFGKYVQSLPWINTSQSRGPSIWTQVLLSTYCSKRKEYMSHILESLFCKLGEHKALLIEMISYQDNSLNLCNLILWLKCKLCEIIYIDSSVLAQNPVHSSCGEKKKKSCRINKWYDEMQDLDLWNELSLDEVLPPSGHWGYCQPLTMLHFPTCLWKNAPIPQFTGCFCDVWLIWVLKAALTPILIPIWPVRSVRTGGVMY